jgi:type IV secretion system protein TrbG
MLSSRIVIIVALSSAWMLFAQSQPPAPPVGVKRVPPAAQGQIPPTNEDSGSLPGAMSGTAPKDLRPKADEPLTSTALEAVRVSERWQGENNAPSPGPDGRVMYSFGAGLPTVVCAPLRVCMIELQAGEEIGGEPHIRDSVRWNISPAMYGMGEQATANLLITTDRRAYYLRLISK